MQERNELRAKLQKIELLGVELAHNEDEEIMAQLEEKRKRCRLNEEGALTFVCKQKNCKKAYSSEQSLQQHVRLKHNMITGKKSDGYERSSGWFFQGVSIMLLMCCF